MQSIVVNGGHLLAVAFGFLAIQVLSASPRLKPFTLLFALVAGAIIGVFVFLQTDAVLFRDFREAYWETGHSILAGPQALAEAYRNPVLVFVNLPIVAYLFAPFGLMPAWVAAWVFFATGVLVAGFAWRAMVKLFALDARESAFLLFAMLVFGPLMYSFKEGNTSHHILAVVLGGWMLARAGKPLAAGALYGFAALLKPPLLLIALLYLIRGRWKTAAGAAALIAVAAGLSLLVFGWDMHVLWYETRIAPFAGGVPPVFVNQTIQSMIAGFGSPVSYDVVPQALDSGAKLAAYGVIVALLALCAFAAWRSGRLFRVTDRDLDPELALVLLFALVASPLSWIHYYVWALPAVALVWVRTRETGAFSLWRLALAACFAAAAPIVWMSWLVREGKFGPLTTLVTSHLVIATVGVFILAALLRARRDA